MARKGHIIPEMNEKPVTLKLLDEDIEKAWKEYKKAWPGTENKTPDVGIMTTSEIDTHGFDTAANFSPTGNFIHLGPSINEKNVVDALAHEIRHWEQFQGMTPEQIRRMQESYKKFKTEGEDNESANSTLPIIETDAMMEETYPENTDYFHMLPREKQKKYIKQIDAGRTQEEQSLAVKDLMDQTVQRRAENIRARKMKQSYNDRLGELNEFQRTLWEYIPDDFVSFAKRKLERTEKRTPSPGDIVAFVGRKFPKQMDGFIRNMRTARGKTKEPGNMEKAWMDYFRKRRKIDPSQGIVKPSGDIAFEVDGEEEKKRKKAKIDREQRIVDSRGRRKYDDNIRSSSPMNPPPKRKH